jgi:hypothetical protein
MSFRRGSSRITLALLTSVAVAALGAPTSDALAFGRGGRGGGGMHMGGGGGGMHIGGGGMHTGSSGQDQAAGDG